MQGDGLESNTATLAASPSNDNGCLTKPRDLERPAAPLKEATLSPSKLRSAVSPLSNTTTAAQDRGQKSVSRNNSAPIEQHNESATKPTDTAHSARVRQLFVGNLPFRMRWQDLKDLCRTAGQVLRADLALGPDHRSKGYGTVLFATVEDAQAAIDMLHNTKWHGRTLEVREDRGYIEQPFQKKGPLTKSASVQHHRPEQKEVKTETTNGYEEIPPCRQLFVGNLPFHCQWQDIKDLFRGAGKVIRADVAQEPGGKSRGFGIVLFATFEDAKKAIDMFDQFEYHGRRLRVHYDKYVSGLPQYYQQQYHHTYNGLLLQQPTAGFGNMEFAQAPDPSVIESLNQTYGGNIHTDGYVAFSLGKSAYVPNPSDAVYSPSIDPNHEQAQGATYLEPFSTAPPPPSMFPSQRPANQDHLLYSHHRPSYDMTSSPYIEYYAPPTASMTPTPPPHQPSQHHPPAVTGTHDYQRMMTMTMNQHGAPSSDASNGFMDADTALTSGFFMQSMPATYQWPTSQEKHEVPSSQTTTVQQPTSMAHYQQSSTFYEQYPFYLQQRYPLEDGLLLAEWQQSDGVNDGTTTPTADSLLDGMQRMGLSEYGSAGLPNLDDSRSTKQRRWN